MELSEVTLTPAEKVQRFINRVLFRINFLMLHSLGIRRRSSILAGTIDHDDDWTPGVVLANHGSRVHSVRSTTSWAVWRRVWRPLAAANAWFFTSVRHSMTTSPRPRA